MEGKPAVVEGWQAGRWESPKAQSQDSGEGGRLRRPESPPRLLV